VHLKHELVEMSTFFWCTGKKAVEKKVRDERFSTSRMAPYIQTLNCFKVREFFLESKLGFLVRVD
jgi:hypothetical protein